MRLLYLVELLFLTTLLSACANYSEISRTSTTSTYLANYREAVERSTYEIRGAVYHPGTYHIRRNGTTDLADAIKAAGGPIETISSEGNDMPALGDVRVVRVIDGLLRIFKIDAHSGQIGDRFRIMPGDKIYVPAIPF